jgi:hypothetical protein
MTRSGGEREDARNARGKSKSPPMTPNPAPERERAHRKAILKCPQCYSHRANFLSIKPPRARCADCKTTYPIKTVNPHPTEPQPADSEAPSQTKSGRKGQPEIDAAPPINARDFGALTDYINNALQAGPEGLRAAQREASKFARKHGLTHFDPHWLACTPWLQRWSDGEFNTCTDGSPAHPGTRNRYVFSPPANGIQRRDSRLRARVAISWRARWLCIYAMSGSKAMACAQAHITENTANYHLRNDPDFAAQADAAREHAIDLLHTRMMQRALEGDIEPIYWQGVKVDHVRRFDSRLQIEMARAHMPDKFKTPGQALVNIETGDKILVMDEATRAKLIDRRREKLLGFKAAREAKELPAQ